MEKSLLRPSSAHRWMLCPGSVSLEAPIMNNASVYAAEGTRAHDIAAKSLLNDYKIVRCENVEMQKHVQTYVDYVREHLSSNCIFEVEKEVDYSFILPIYINQSLTGTVDAFIYNENTLHIFDFKYGKGVEVLAKDNEQLMLYTLGVYDLLKSKNINLNNLQITLHIIQPRIYTSIIKTHDLSHSDLINFMYKASSKAIQALYDKDTFVPGAKQCRFCKASPNCQALLHKTKDIVFKSNAVKSDILDSEKREILLNEKLILNLIQSIKDELIQRIKDNETIPGVTLGNTKGRRVWRDTAEDYLIKTLGDKAYKKSLITITEAEKLINKKEISEYTEKSVGKETLYIEDIESPEDDDKKAERNIDDFFK